MPKDRDQFWVASFERLSTSFQKEVKGLLWLWSYQTGWIGGQQASGILLSVLPAGNTNMGAMLAVIFTWILGLRLRSSRLVGKLFTDCAISQLSAAFYRTVGQSRKGSCVGLHTLFLELSVTHLPSLLLCLESSSSTAADKVYILPSCFGKIFGV